MSQNRDAAKQGRRKRMAFMKRIPNLISRFGAHFCDGRSSRQLTLCVPPLLKPLHASFPIGSILGGKILCNILSRDGYKQGMSLLLAFIILLLLIGTGFLSASETAITAASKPKLHHMAKRGDKNALHIRYLQETPG